MSTPSAKPSASYDLLGALSELRDPRSRACAYPLEELLFAALCGVSSGADSWVSVTDWAGLQLDWLRRHLPFVNGVASHDTFSRVFSLLDPRQFEAFFVRWMQHLCPALNGELIAIDGKSLRGSHDGSTRMTHLVSAWHHAQGLVLGQIKTAAKSNEITAIPELIEALQVQGATLTLDAAGCQHAVVQAIVAKQADYIIAVKNNQPTLAQAIEKLFDANDRCGPETALAQVCVVDKGHARVETRQCVVAHDLSALGDAAQGWLGLRSVARIKSTREIVNGKAKGETSTEWRYYMSSTLLSAEQFEAAVRAHWGIENSCHWVLDMAFSEDDCRIRTGDGAENFAILRRISLNLLTQDKSTKTSMNIKRQKAGWSTRYLETVLRLKGYR
jgi:predicted transposase YbfD/YdcC